ncbi:MAG: ankyrin repeat domain-containing protein [Deltaproteobacteria bacterium]|nr:ankyrin repeat domain-containing protein [Deltaproteobacteria bacterium]
MRIICFILLTFFNSSLVFGERLKYTGDSPLIKAASQGNLEEVQRLIEEGADIDEVDSIGRNSLEWAVCGGHLSVVRYFICDRRADIRQTDQYNQSLLHKAARQGDLEVVEFLIDQGLDFRLINSYGMTTLHNAAMSGNPGTVECLLKKAKEAELPPEEYVDKSDWYCRTPLFIAKQELASVTKELAKQNSSVTARILARQARIEETVELIKNALKSEKQTGCAPCLIQ